MLSVGRICEGMDALRTGGALAGASVRNEVRNELRDAKNGESGQKWPVAVQKVDALFLNLGHAGV